MKCSGAIDTPLVRNIGVTVDTPGLNFAIKRLGEAEEVASVIAFLLGDESKYVTGSTYCVDGGLLA
jgi:NAD(P)-dependent dehydrogenase (short-subunit alcohol dehydrogenase family)